MNRGTVTIFSVKQYVYCKRVQLACGELSLNNYCLLGTYFSDANIILNYIYMYEDGMCG